MSAALRLMAYLYRLGLGLYPAAFRREYAEEMQAVFRLRAADAACQGALAFARLACREAITLPAAARAAHRQALFPPERGPLMLTHLFPATSDRTPWPVALLSLLPAFVLGPVTVALNFHPGWEEEDLPWLTSLDILPFAIALFVIAFVIGAVKKFPRWSYVYAAHIWIGLSVLLLAAVGLIPFGEWWILPPATLVVALALRWLPFLRRYFANAAQDWTLLSYTFYGMALILLMMTDRVPFYDYSWWYVAPSLIGWLGALAYLRLGNPLARVAALLGAMMVSTFFWMFHLSIGMDFARYWPQFVNPVLIIWAVLGTLILAPMLGSLWLRSRPARQS